MSADFENLVASKNVVLSLMYLLSKHDPLTNDSGMKFWRKCEEVDAIEYYQVKREKLEREFEVDRNLDSNETGVAFIAFQNGTVPGLGAEIGYVLDLF